SALGADGESSSSYARTKAGGERAAIEAFEGTTVIRPSVVFGADDDFTNKFAALTALVPALPLLGGGSMLMQPVWVEDLANAIVKIIETPSHQGKIYEFGGPDKMPLSQIIASILKNTKRNCLILPAPKGVMNMAAFFLQLIPGKPFLTTDQVKLLGVDNVVGGDQAGFENLGIEPATLDATLPSYMTRYQKGGGYNQLHA
ncbi:MAG: sugar nucleotide-binding protein, partial [Sneathiella sp.]|nr:sugar nucleotide-binding protein [Sneathiella sp.]